MTKMERARRVRDLVLADAGLCLDESLRLSDGVLIAAARWRASIRRERLVFPPAGAIQATKLVIWIDGERTAVMAWTGDMLRLVKYACGEWETTHFKLPRYRNSAERWLDACDALPVDSSVLDLMRSARPREIDSVSA
jgi:hypothetical protein